MASGFRFDKQNSTGYIGPSYLSTMNQNFRRETVCVLPPMGICPHGGQQWVASKRSISDERLLQQRGARQAKCDARRVRIG